MKTAVYILAIFILISAEIKAEVCQKKVGVILPLTGNASSYGKRAQQGALLAQALFKTQCEFELFFEDSRFESAAGVSAYRFLKQKHKIEAVITGASQVSLPVRELTFADKLPQVAIFTAAEDYSTPNQLSFRISLKPDKEVAPLVDIVYASKMPTVGTLYIANDFGEPLSRAIIKQFRAKGISVPFEESFLPTATDFKAEVLRAKNANVSHIFVVGLPFQYANIVKAARQINFSPIFLSPRTAEDPAMAPLNLKYGNFLYSYPFDSDSPAREVSTFVNEYQRRYGEKPDAYAAEGFEAVHLLALAFSQCKLSQCIAQTLRDKEFATVFGKIKFNETGDVIYPLFSKTIDGNTFTRYNN